MIDVNCLLSECMRRLEEITGHDIPFYKVDILDADALRDIFSKVPLRNSYKISITHSVVQECCKGDEAGQWRMKKVPPPRPNPVCDRNTNGRMWLRRGPLHLCKSSSRSAQAFRFCACVTLRTKNVSFFSFFGFLQLATAKGPGRILTQNTPKHAVPPKDVPFRGREHKI